MSAPSNLDRAMWADEALKIFMTRTGCDCEDSLTDLLADLMHWSDKAGQCFAVALYRARYHYAAELAEGGEA
jgi:hypothetical protein